MKQRLCHCALPPLRAVVPRSLSKNNASASRSVLGISDVPTDVHTLSAGVPLASYSLRICTIQWR